jgi:hypothetical protein
MNVGRYLRGEDRHVGTARTTQPQPPQRTEQEPVAWMDADGNVSDNNDHKCFPIPLYTTPPQRTWVGAGDLEDSNSYLDTPPQRTEQEPVAWKDKTYGNLHHQDFGNSIPLYITPPQRKPLTDEEIDKLLGPFPRYADEWSMTDFIRFARAIEAAHGIKE